MKLECRICHQLRDEEDFRIYINGGRPARRRKQCKFCQNSQARLRPKKKISKQYIRAKNLRIMYGITIDDWDALFESQNKRCAICDRDRAVGRGWATDHDHRTEKVRGILCTHCNTILGHAFDNVDILVKAIEYLQCHQNV